MNVNFIVIMARNPSYQFTVSKLSTLSKENLKVCKRIKDLRNGLGHTQAMLADICGVNVSTIKHIETGIHLPTLDILRTISKHFNVSYGFLIDGKK